jgi:hypothetical protein
VSAQLSVEQHDRVWMRCSYSESSSSCLAWLRVISAECFERYHIVSLADIQESGAKMDKWIKEQRGSKAMADKDAVSRALMQTIRFITIP